MQRFPRKQSEGDIPQFAIATGSADAFECLMLKMLDAAEFTRPDGSGRVHMYVTPQGNPAPLQLAGGAPPPTSLWGDAGDVSPSTTWCSCPARAVSTGSPTPASRIW